MSWCRWPQKSVRRSITAERLIEVLLILARNDQARVLTDALDLAVVAEDALEGRTANGITTIITLDEAPVTGDAVLLERLVANLLDNAQRYNIASGTIAISTTTDNAASLVRVVNTGRVVPPDQVDRLFLPFTRIDDRTRHDGFGLGLALVSSIATVHSGTVHATALITGGLDITVRLPRRYPQEQDDRPRTETQTSPPVAPCLSRKARPLKLSRLPRRSRGIHRTGSRCRDRAHGRRVPERWRLRVDPDVPAATQIDRAATEHRVWQVRHAVHAHARRDCDQLELSALRDL